MRANELKIDVTASIKVDGETADKCLRLLEWYANDHNELMLMGDKDNDGRYHFYFKRKDENYDEA